MSGELATVRDGLATLLTSVPGMRVIDHPPESVHEFPAAVLLLESRSVAETLGGTRFTGRIKAVVLVASANVAEAFNSLDSIMDPEGVSSIEAIIANDRTWIGSVDDGWLESIDNVGRRNLWGGSYVAADFHFRFVRG